MAGRNSSWRVPTGSVLPITFDVCDAAIVLHIVRQQQLQWARPLRPASRRPRAKPARQKLAASVNIRPKYI